MGRPVAVAIVVVAALLAVEVARLSAAGALAETRPQLASALAPSHPDVLVSTAMAEVGEAAAYGREPPEPTMERLRQLARVAPLSPEPLLVDAAIAQRNSDFAGAERLLLEARRRDPRSTAARYLLADAWIRQGRIADGLVEMAVLARLLPRSAAQLAPVLAEYAQNPGAREQLKRVLAVNPQLRLPLLNVLSADPDNAELTLDLAGSPAGTAGSRPPAWQTRLLEGLVARGDYQRAYALWQRFAGFTGPRPLVFNGDFRQVAAPAPFNWSLASGRGGVAEPADGRMRVIHYGREDVTLASQLLLLPAGNYRLSVPVSGNAPSRALVWTVSCVPGNQSLMQLQLGSAGAQRSFEVPAGRCPAQRLELSGRAQDMPQESDLLVGPVSVERVGQ